MSCKVTEKEKRKKHYNASFNKSRVWDIDDATNKKIRSFYKALTFKWHVSKFEPNRIIWLQITII